MSSESRARAWVEVDRAAFRRNVRRIRNAVGSDVGLVPMVKADAYGLGVREAVGALADERPWGHGVATVEEGLELRRLGVEGPVLVCSPVPPETVPPAVEGDLTLSVSDPETVEALRRAAVERGRRADFHVEVDTGMGRAGLDWRRAAEWAPAVRRAADEGAGGRASRGAGEGAGEGAAAGALAEDGRSDPAAGGQGADGPPGARWAGLYTHFHSADEPGDRTAARQWERLSEVAGVPEVPGDLLLHAANSAGVFRAPEAHAQAVRPGIFLYGGRPGPDLPAPEPVAHVRARVVRVHDVPSGATVGYGSTYTSSRRERWATLAIGYGDGLRRALGNQGDVLLRGRRVPIIGRISMDVTVVDITDLETGGGGAPVRPGEVATVLGADEEGLIPLEEMAERAGTINYEILTGWSSRLPRVWTDGD